MRRGKWDARIARARELASAHPFASESLRSYGSIAQFQKSLYGDLEAKCGKEQVTRLPGTLRQEFDLFVLLPRFAPFLAIVEKKRPRHSRRPQRDCT